MGVQILIGDVRQRLKDLPDESVHCVVTSPPYFGLRDYGHAGQIGLEPTPDAFVAAMVEVFREVRRLMRRDATCWINLGDSYGPNKQLLGIPWRVAFALQADGWWLRQDIIWHKPNPMPESVRDRCTKAHEYLFLLTKSERYFYDADAIREPHQSEPWTTKTSTIGEVYGEDWQKRRDTKGEGLWTFNRDPNGRNKRSVWTIATQPYSEAHFATFPPELPELCIKAGTSERGCCPHCGAGWVKDGRADDCLHERIRQGW